MISGKLVGESFGSSLEAFGVHQVEGGTNNVDGYALLAGYDCGSSVGEEGTYLLEHNDFLLA